MPPSSRKPSHRAPVSGKRKIRRASKKNGWIVAGIALGAFALLVIFTTLNTLRSESSAASAASGAASPVSMKTAGLDTPAATTAESNAGAWDPTTDPLWSEIRQVAENFLCGCGQCSDPLIKCTCTDGTGGNNEKLFIRDLLAKGLTPEETIPIVENKFGQRIQASGSAQES